MNLNLTMCHRIHALIILLYFQSEEIKCLSVIKALVYMLEWYQYCPLLVKYMLVFLVGLNFISFV